MSLVCSCSVGSPHELSRYIGEEARQSRRCSASLSSLFGTTVGAVSCVDGRAYCCSATMPALPALERRAYWQRRSICRYAPYKFYRGVDATTIKDLELLLRKRWIGQALDMHLPVREVDTGMFFQAVFDMTTFCLFALPREVIEPFAMDFFKREFLSLLHAPGTSRFCFEQLLSCSWVENAFQGIVSRLRKGLAVDLSDREKRFQILKEDTFLRYVFIDNLKKTDQFSEEIERFLGDSIVKSRFLGRIEEDGNIRTRFIEDLVCSVLRYERFLSVIRDWNLVQFFHKMFVFSREASFEEKLREIRIFFRGGVANAHWYKAIDCEQMGVLFIPSQLGKLTHIRSIWARNNYILSVEGAAHSKKLVHMELGGNYMRNIPLNSFKSPFLNRISLFHGEEVEVPEGKRSLLVSETVDGME